MLQLSSHTKWSWIVSVFNIGVLVVVKDMTMTANDKETSWRREEKSQKSPQKTMSEYVVENKFFLFLCAADLTLLKSAPSQHSGKASTKELSKKISFHLKNTQASNFFQALVSSLWRKERGERKVGKKEQEERRKIFMRKLWIVLISPLQPE